jgi:translation initiation factor 1A
MLYWNSLEEETYLTINGLLFSQNHSDQVGASQQKVRKMGKRKITNEGNLDSMVLPSQNDVLGMAVKMLGGERMIVKCQDGKERLCRVRGKLKRRVWIREGDIVLVSPWDFQADTRGDIFWRYRKNQSDWLRSHNYLKL